MCGCILHVLMLPDPLGIAWPLPLWNRAACTTVHALGVLRAEEGDAGGIGMTQHHDRLLIPVAAVPVSLRFFVRGSRFTIPLPWLSPWSC